MHTKEKRNALRYLFGKSWQYSRGNHRNVFWYWVMSMTAETIDTIFSPFVWAKMIEVITTQGITDTSMPILWILLGLVLLRTFASWSFHVPARLLEQDNAFKVKVNYRKFLLKGIMTLPLAWHVEHHSGDTIDKTEKGANALCDFSEESFMTIRSIIQLVGSYVVLVYFSHSAAYIVIIMILISAWITMRFDKILLGQYKEINHLENQASEGVFDAISNITTIIVLRVEKLVFKALISKIERPHELYKCNNRLNELKWFLTSLSCNTMTVIVLGFYFLQHYGAAAGVLVANFYLLTNYLDRISELFFRFTGAYGTIVRRKSRVMNSEELIKDFVEENFTNHVLPAQWRKLDIRNLSFSYQGDKTELHLNNVALTITRGERIALVGETGSGKTTLLKIMRGLHAPRNLTLSVDGKNIPQGFDGISRTISLVQQDPEIFANTIFENITMGAEYDFDFVCKFSDMALFTDVALNLPKGFYSSIKEKGVNLSGGQQQRLALSRGLLACHDKDIVLLDEPTSSLDTITEVSVYQNIFRAFKEKTIISTTHQLHILPLFDRICVFDRGEIIGSGTMSELFTSCQKFVSLWETMQKAKTGHIEVL